MNKLIHELQRLYFIDDGDRPDALSAELLAASLAGGAPLALHLVSTRGRVRSLVLGFARAADWPTVAELYQALQEDLELPAPAVAVSGRAGYQLWLSLTESLPLGEAGRFLDALCRNYLPEIPLASLSLDPAMAGPGVVGLVPALDETSGKWSAFIDPSMGAMFVDESGLDMAPNMDRQADMLSGLASIELGDFQRALAHLESQLAVAASPPESSAVAGQAFPPAGRTRARLDVGSNFTDPKSFLLAVMNDASASAGQRIKAAKALLPYFEGDGRE